jgi:hypothetical protein
MVSNWITIFLLVFGLGFTFVTPFTMVGMRLVPFSFFLGSWRLGLYSWWVVGCLPCFIEVGFFQWGPLTWLLLVFGRNLDGCPKSEVNVVSLDCWVSRWLERTAYRFVIGTIYWQEFEVPKDACAVFGGRVAVGPREFFGFTLSAFESTRDVCFRDLNSSLNVLVNNFTELSSLSATRSWDSS